MRENLEQKMKEKTPTINEYYADMKKTPQINSVNISKYIKHNQIYPIFCSDFHP